MSTEDKTALIRERNIQELRRSLRTALLVLAVVTILGLWIFDIRVTLFIPAMGLPSLFSLWLYLRRLEREQKEEAGGNVHGYDA